MNAGGSEPAGRRIKVLGVGNLLWADEGFGVRCVEALQAGWTFAPHVQLVDGGTQGLYLLPQVQSASKLLIFDAVDYGLAPGTLKLVENDEVPRFLGAKKMSLHQTGFQEVLSLAQLTGRYPREVLLIGCQRVQQVEDGNVDAAADRGAPRALRHLADHGLRHGLYGQGEGVRVLVGLGVPARASDQPRELRPDRGERGILAHEVQRLAASDGERG